MKKTAEMTVESLEGSENLRLSSRTTNARFMSSLQYKLTNLMVAMLIVLSERTSCALGANTTFGPRYLVKSEASALSGDLHTTLQELHGNITATRSTFASESDDGLIDLRPLGFSFPFFGNSRVRTAGLDPNGHVRFDSYAEDYPCKESEILYPYFDQHSSISCSGLLNFSNVLGPFITDLWPGEPTVSNHTDSSVYFWADSDQEMFSVLWENFKFFYPSGLGSDEDSIVALNLTFGMTLSKRGNVRFWYDTIPDIKSLDFKARGIFAGLRAPSFMDSNAADYLTSGELATQSEWGGFLASPPTAEAAGFFVDPANVTENMIVDICLVPDWNLKTMAEEAICVVPSLANANTSLVMEVPEDLLSCVAVDGISLYCRYPGEDDLLSSISETNQIICPLPSSVDYGDIDAINLTLVFIGADNADERAVSFNFCDTVDGPTLDYLLNDTCSLDYLGEPAIRDCLGVCNGTATLDADGTCCDVSEIGCNGLCAVSTDDETYEAAFLRIFVETTTKASNQLVCCASDYIDCDGVCRGCTCSDDCGCPLSADQRSYCPTTSTPTLQPSSSGTIGKTFSTQLIAIVISSTFVLAVLLQCMRVQILKRIGLEEWQLVVRERPRPPPPEPENLTPAQIEKYTSTTTFHHIASKASPQESIKKPSFKFGGNFMNLHGDVDDDGMCPICICDFEDDDELRKLPCGHFFHKDCVDEWFERSTVCPMCKRDVRGDDAPKQKKKDEDDIEDFV